MSPIKTLWGQLTGKEDNGNAASAKDFSLAKIYMGITETPSSTPAQDLQTGTLTSIDSFLDKSNPSVNNVTQLNQQPKTPPDAKLKIGDRVKHGKQVGTITDIPNTRIAWVQLDSSPENCVQGLNLENLEIMKDPVLGPGGAPTRATTLPDDPKERKNYPIASGVLDYFPDALVAISEVSKAGNDQHNPGLPLRWTRSKSGDESDTCMRHFLQRGTLDTDGKRHTAKAAWRILALLQKEIEKDEKV